MDVHKDFNMNGGLTLVPAPGYEATARAVKKIIEGRDGKKYRKTPVDIADPQFGLRSSGEPFLQLGKEHIGGHDCVVITSGPGTYKMIGQTQFLLRYVAGHRARRITLVTGYLPLSRSDKDEGEIEFALTPMIVDFFRAAARTENTALDRIIGVDLHSPQGVMAGPTGFITEVSMIRRLLQVVSEDAFKLSNKIVLDFPDDGSAKRVENEFALVARALDFEFPEVYGAKRRKSSKESGLKNKFGDTDALSGATVLSLDDEWATGGTGINNAASLKSDFGAKLVWMLVTHGVICGDACAKLARPDCPVDRLYISDTISIEGRDDVQELINAGKIVVLSWVKDLANIIYHHHWDISIRGLR